MAEKPPTGEEKEKPSKLSLSKSSERVNDGTSRRAKFRNALAERRAERQAERNAKVSNLTGEELDLATQTRSINGATIAESYKHDEYVRDGNVLFPAPVPRPAGVAPSMVRERDQELSEAEQELRDEAASRGEPREEGDR